ncbi:copper amine oxidase [Phaeosphaeriaceae sp. PMI808]|nr:copper amine oxidase [Phaeosphaeriaceae sp. PMI808]
MKRTACFTLGISALLSFAHAQNGKCSIDQLTVSSPQQNPWKALSEDESASVNGLLQKKFNLTGNQGSSRDSYVVQVTLLYPNKTDVVAFLDKNTTASLARTARATVQFGATNSTDSYWQEYAVGPLPATSLTRILPLTFPFHNEQPGKTKVHPIYSPLDAALFQAKISTELTDITMILWNTTIAEQSIGLRFGVPFWNQEGRAISWCSFFANPDSTLVSSPTLAALGVSVQLDLTGRNWEDWKIMGLYSRGIYYTNIKEFRIAISSTSFDKPPRNVIGNWTSTDKQGDPLPLDDLPPPVSVPQGAQRFKVDAKENYISWMDFSFYYSVSQAQGLSLRNIQYKGKRIVYDLSLEESLTHYSGSDPFAAQATFFDTQTGMGSTLNTLVEGYDCPSYATYLNATFSEGNGTKTQVNAICAFEYDAGYPIRRHSFSPASPHTSIGKNIVFTIRTISTVGNYDFFIEYNFFYDGAIEVSARASGYISAAYWEGRSDYGFHIHDHLSGSLHDHTLTFKIDIDILGDRNSIQKIDFIPESATYPWSQGRPHNTFKAARSIIASESSINWASNDATLYSIVNKDMPNRFGEFPGYRMKKSAGTSHLTIRDSTNVRKAAGYATHDFYFTKQKDTEPRAADASNRYAPEDPLVDFSRFLDEESIEQEDIVIWFNLGMHHMPHTGDLPNTMFTSAHSAMRFEPLNYLDGDPSVQSNQQVRIDYNDDGSVAYVEEFGKKKTTCG